MAKTVRILATDTPDEARLKAAVLQTGDTLHVEQGAPTPGIPPDVTLETKAVQLEPTVTQVHSPYRSPPGAWRHGRPVVSPYSLGDTVRRLRLP